MNRGRYPQAITLCLAALLAASGCATDPDVAKREAFDSGNRYFGQGDYGSAIIEFRSALQHDPRFGEARYRLAEAYARTNEQAHAAQEYIRAAELLPGHVEAQFKAAHVLLLAGRFEEAHAVAEAIAAKDPKNVDAQLLIGNATAGLKDLDQAALTIEAAARSDGTRGYPYSNLGAIEMMRGRVAEAEAAFRKAIDLETASVPARLGLANFLRATGRLEEAEQTVKEALAIDPAHVFANRVMAALYIASGRAAEAERHVRTVADVSGDAASRLALADYYAASWRLDEALQVLRTVMSKPEDREDGRTVAAVRVRTAEITFAQGRRTEAHTAVDEALRAEPQNPAAVLLKARLLAADGRLDDALTRVTGIADATIVSAGAHFLTGQIYAAQNKPDEALAAFSEALRLQPGAPRVQLELAKLHLARGEADIATPLAAAAAKGAPANLEARVLFIRGLTARGQFDAAGRELAAIPPDQAKSGSVQAAAGALALARGNGPAAALAFERADALRVGGTESLAGLVAVDLKAGRVDEARRRVEARRAQEPANASVAVLAGLVYMAGKQTTLAAHALERAIELDPLHLQAYLLLARLYIGDQRLDEARRKFDAAAERQTQSVAARTMAAMILHMQGRVEEAERRYQQILAQDPNAAVAANNQAWIYAERGENLDIALQLAQAAKARLPDVAAVSETLGWVLYKKNLPELAVQPLLESTQQDPANPVHRYRLGLAYLKAANQAGARRELAAALKMNPSFPHADHARALLTQLD